MQAHLYVREGSETTLLCKVNLEVVPGGTYVIDGVPYKLADKPTFVIAKEQVDGWDTHVLQFVNLIMERL
jgi:hypothetical protein